MFTFIIKNVIKQYKIWSNPFIHQNYLTNIQCIPNTYTNNKTQKSHSNDLLDDLSNDILVQKC